MVSGGIEIPDILQEEAAAEAQKHAIYFVLEEANLEVAKVGKNYELLNCDDHTSFLRRHGKDPASYRPDITHQVFVAYSTSIYVQLCFASFSTILAGLSLHILPPASFSKFSHHTADASYDFG